MSIFIQSAIRDLGVSDYIPLTLANRILHDYLKSETLKKESESLYPGLLNQLNGELRFIPEDEVKQAMVKIINRKCGMGPNKPAVEDDFTVVNGVLTVSARLEEIMRRDFYAPEKIYAFNDKLLRQWLKDNLTTYGLKGDWLHAAALDRAENIYYNEDGQRAASRHMKNKAKDYGRP